MNAKELFNLYILKNKKLIHFLLQSIKECIPQKYWDKYATQIDCINKIQWVLDVEVDLYFDSDDLCRKSLIQEWEKEQIIAKVVIIDAKGKKYRLNFFSIKGHIFSIESNLPFRYLKVEEIKDLQISCEVERKRSQS